MTVLRYFLLDVGYGIQMSDEYMYFKSVELVTCFCFGEIRIFRGISDSDDVQVLSMFLYQRYMKDTCSNNWFVKGFIDTLVSQYCTYCFYYA